MPHLKKECRRKWSWFVVVEVDSITECRIDSIIRMRRVGLLTAQDGGNGRSYFSISRPYRNVTSLVYANVGVATLLKITK